MQQEWIQRYSTESIARDAAETFLISMGKTIDILECTIFAEDADCWVALVRYEDGK